MTATMGPPHPELSPAGRVNHQWNRLSEPERAVAQYLVTSPPQLVVFATADELGRRTGTSAAVVAGTARRLGYPGLPALKASLGRAAAAPQLGVRLQLAQDLPGAATHLVRDALGRITAFARGLDVAEVGKAVALLGSASRIFCYGWGVNELSARYLALKLTRAGRSAQASGATGYAFADDLADLSPRHAVVAFAPGRVLPELELLVAHTKKTGAGLILVTEHIGEELAGHADVVLRERGSPGGLTAEPLCAMLLADLLVLGGLADGPAVDTYALLTELRGELREDRP